MFVRSARLAAWAMLAVIVIVTIAPVAFRPDFGHVNIERFVGFAVLAFVFALAYPRRLLVLCVVVVSVAALLEFLQLFIPGRDAALANFLIKLGGGFLGLGLGGTVNLAARILRPEAAIRGR